MGKSPPSSQTVTQKTEIDPIQKSFLFGTPLPDEYRTAMEARNAQVMGMPAPGADANGGGTTQPALPFHIANIKNPEAEAYAGGSGGIAALANGGMVPSQLPDLSSREQAYMMGLQALQGATQPQMSMQQPMGMQPQPMGMQRPMAMQQPMGYAMGGYIEGPGTGRSDSIPATIYQDGQPVQDAALSDGEFVMTERAVRGAGNGDREAGAARMYEMMRRFENGGRT